MAIISLVCMAFAFLVLGFILGIRYCINVFLWKINRCAKNKELFIDEFYITYAEELK